MRDSDIYSPFMELLRGGLWNRIPDNTLFPLSYEQWIKLRKIGAQQTVTAILYDGMLLLPEEYHPPLDILMGWATEVEIIERRNKSMDNVAAQLHKLFVREGVSLTLLKGQGLATFYNYPQHRVCGDIDWYIPSALDRKISESILRNKGVTMKKQAGFSQMYFCKGIVVEHHNHLLDCHNPFARNFLHELEKRESQKGLSLSLLGEEILLPSPLIAHLQVNMHILKHMLSFGIGLRQLCDSARLYYSLHEKVDGSELELIYRKLGVYHWVQVLDELLVKELGLLPEYLPFPRKNDTQYEWMMQEVWSCGNFGFHDCRYGGHDVSFYKRRHVWKHWLHRFRLHLSLAPYETLWFPFSHLISKFESLVNSH